MGGSPSYYFEIDDKDVRRLARAICVARGFDPDGLIPETGYSNAASIPAWWKYQDAAVSFLAMTRELAARPLSPDGAQS